MADQAANNGGSQAAGKSFVQFSRPAAQRIAKVVRTVEAGNRSQSGVVFDHPMPSATGKIFRVGTYTGEWSKATSRTVQFLANTSTVSAYNLFATVGNTSGSSTNCAIAKDGTAWYLIASEC